MSNIFFKKNNLKKYLEFLPFLTVILGCFIGWHIGLSIGSTANNIENSKFSLKYYNESNYKKSVKIAVNYWNNSGIINFIEVNDANKSDLIIKENSEILNRHGENSIALAELKAFRKDIIYLPDLKDKRFIYLQEEVKTIAHELGHILGLDHRNSENDCSIMAHSIHNYCQDKYTTEFNICGPNFSDLKILNKRFSDRKINHNYSPVCNFKLDNLASNRKNFLK